MPFKTFVAGEILTASDVNTFLGAQAISVFADATARDAAITSPVEGQFAFRTDDDVLEYWDGSAWEEYATGLAVECLVVAGGGSGASTDLNFGSGGGAGGVIEKTLALPTFLQAPPFVFDILVGAGGAGVSGRLLGLVGNQSDMSEVSVGGGGGSETRLDASQQGGSGGGGPGGTGASAPGGQGVRRQGNSGGAGFLSATAAQQAGGGGGGAGGVGGDATNTLPGDGGIGISSTIISTANASTATVGQVSGSDVYFGGGGGGDRRGGISTGGVGGLGGGGSARGGAGTARTGGGGAAGNPSGAGGSGVVILRAPTSVNFTFSVGVTQSTGSPFTEGPDRVWVITAAGPTDTVTIG
jgi:hypothetical protein